MSAAAPDGRAAALAAQRRLARTINAGLDLGAPLERGWTVALDRDHLAACADAGFTAVRLLVCLAEHVDPAGRIDATTLARVDALLDAAAQLGLAVVVANHRDPALMADPDRHLARLLATTGALAEALRPRGADVVLEPLGEAEGALDGRWNDVVGRLVAAVRERDAHRTILVGPRTYANARFLPELALPREDRNIVVGVHHYWPIRFTMQGERWLGTTELGDPADWCGTTWDGTPPERAELTAGFDGLAAWGAAQDRPLLVSELGTSVNADLPSRARWTAFNRELAEARGIAWGVWSLGPSFAIFDLARRRFVPELLRALIPRP